jgi:hypothetical protein
LAVPVEVTIRGPADAQILSGPKQFVIPASPQPYVIEQEIVVSSNGHPMGDLVLEAHAAGPTFGFHAKDAHTFGRHRAAASKPATEGPNLKVGDRDFGASVPMAP